MVGRPGWPDPIHDRRAGAGRRFEGIPRAGTVSHLLHDGDGWRSAVAPARGEYREGPKDVPGELDAGANPRRRIRARACGGPGETYEGGNKPFVDFNAVVAGTDRTRQFVKDDRAVANIILGRGIPPPPPSDKGHFHTESSEFWFILLGQIRYTIEGLPTFVADQGDIVYVPKQRWHLASFAGDGMSARLAMNGYVDLAHSFEAPDTGEASR